MEPWRPDYMAAWQTEEEGQNEGLKHFVHQYQEQESADGLPHVLVPVAGRATANGQAGMRSGLGDNTPNYILSGAPTYVFSGFFMDIPPDSPVRGAHRHISAPTIFATRGKGWEWNDGKTYDFEQYDLLVVPPYTVHQHGCDREVGTSTYVMQTSRVGYVLGSLGSREQHKFSEKPVFPVGTEPLYDERGELKGYRIKKGVLGLTEDLDVILGPNAYVEDVFDARKAAGEFDGKVDTVYDNYIKTFHDECIYLENVDHVIVGEKQHWEWTPQGKLRWYIHPSTDSSAKDKWIYMQEIPAGSRSGRHVHASEELILVLEGGGYDVHGDQRWNWETGNLIVIPAMTPHQHFATSESRAVLLHTLAKTYTNLGLGGIAELEDCPEWAEEEVRVRS